MFKRKTFRLGSVMAVFATMALACTCGALGQVQQGVQTAQALATQGQGLVTQAQGLATQGVALATQVEQSGLLKTAQAAVTQLATSGALETLQAVGTQVDQSGALQTVQAAVTQNVSSTGVPDDIPIYPKNSSMQSIAGIVTYEAQADLATVSKFYATEMPKKGWVQAQAPLTSTAATVLTYKKGNRQATINMLNAQTATTVAIQIQP